MKNTLLLLALVFSLISCSKKSELSKKHNCNTAKIENPKLITDYNKNFKLTIPNNWNTRLYFSEFESEIFAADTLKQLTESFILATSFNFGELTLDTIFYKKTDSILLKNNLQIIDTGTDNFKSKQTYWYVAKGFKNGFTFHQFNLTSKRSENTYFNASSEIYGDQKISERICETILIIENIEFLQ